MNDNTCGEPLVLSDAEGVVMDAGPIHPPPVTYETRQDMLSKDWKFNFQLSRIATKISTADLKVMKLLISGDEGTPRGTCEAIKDGIDLINHLKHRGFLDKYNLLHLQALVWATGNTTLHEELVKFAKSCREQPLHFFAPNTTTDVGQQNVQLHVGGQATSLAEIEQLRNLVAEYLCLPNDNVIVNGVNPFRSIVITLLIPSKAVGYLLNLAAYQKSRLQDLNIDKIMIGDNEVILTDAMFEKLSPLTENDEIRRIAAGKEKLEKELERTQNQLLQKERELKNVFEELNIVKMAYQKISTPPMSEAQPSVKFCKDNPATEEYLFADEHVVTTKESTHTSAMLKSESLPPDDQPKS